MRTDDDDDNFTPGDIKSIGYKYNFPLQSNSFHLMRRGNGRGARVMGADKRLGV